MVKKYGEIADIITLDLREESVLNSFANTRSEYF